MDSVAFSNGMYADPIRADIVLPGWFSALSISTGNDVNRFNIAQSPAR